MHCHRIALQHFPMDFHDALSHWSLLVHYGGVKVKAKVKAKKYDQMLRRTEKETLMLMPMLTSIQKMVKQDGIVREPMKKP